MTGLRWLTRFGRPDCHEVAEVIQAFLDDEADELAARRVARHLKHCRRCGMEAATYLEIKRSLQPPQPNPGTGVDRAAPGLRRDAGQGAGRVTAPLANADGSARLSGDGDQLGYRLGDGVGMVLWRPVLGPIDSAQVGAEITGQTLPVGDLLELVAGAPHHPGGYLEGRGLGRSELCPRRGERRSGGPWRRRHHGRRSAASAWRAHPSPALSCRVLARRR